MSLHKTSIFFSFIALLFFPYVHAGFVEGTLVKTAEGFIPIQELAIGDEICCFDEDTNEFSHRTVIDISKNEVLYAFYIQTNSNYILADTDQQFYLLTEQAWCCAQDLKPGMVLQSCYERQIVVKSIDEVRINAIVYDLTLDEPHTFCVTLDGIVVHNFVLETTILVFGAEGITIASGILASALSSVGAYLFYKVISKTTGAHIAPNLDISNAFGPLDSHYDAPGHGARGAFEIEQGNGCRHSDGHHELLSVQPINNPVFHCGNSNLSKSLEVHDTRSFPVPKFELGSEIGCGTGLLPSPYGQGENRPACDQEVDKREVYGCGTGIRPACEQAGNKGNSDCGICIIDSPEDGRVEDEIPSGNIVWPLKDHNVLYKKSPEPKAPDPNGAQAPGLPEEKHGFEPPKKWDGEKVKHRKGYGWPDREGNIWIPTGPNGHGGPHWDVQLSDSDNDYINVYPNGHIRQGRRK